MARTKKGITGIAVGFNEALDPSSAMNPAFYSLDLGVKKKKRRLMGSDWCLADL